MSKGKIYELTMPTTVKDCIGNNGVGVVFPIALPELAEPKDIVINEILFNPKTSGYDFIEFYNRSDKAINLSGLIIDNKLGSSVPQEITSNYLLLPKNYVVISENIDNIKANYDVKNAKALLQNALPSFADDEGNITLYRPDAPGKKIIDALNYNKSWHYGLLQNQSGVSLERLNPELPTQDSTNWHSAASVVGFATPTYQNSQFFVSQKADNELFTIENSRLSPDNDGFEDFTIIRYKATNDLNATLRVFDLNGRLVKTIAQNETLATEGQLRWDGDSDDGSRATLGIYVLLIDYFTPDGKVGKEKKTLTVVYRL
jgi:Lamin Tail Domain/CHU_C Type IX secretion signal domain